jgi:hypothetical protein
VTEKPGVHRPGEPSADWIDQTFVQKRPTPIARTPTIEAIAAAGPSVGLLLGSWVLGGFLAAIGAGLTAIAVTAWLWWA